MNNDVEALTREYEQAILAERALWGRVKGRHPGTDGHDSEDWAKWLAAAERVRDLSMLLQALGSG